MQHHTRKRTASVSTPSSTNHPVIPRKKRPPEENIMRTMFKPASAMYSFQRPPLPTDKPIALYGRQSTLGQIELNTTSYDYQIEKQKEHIIEMGWSADLIVEYFQDFAVSATFGFGVRVGLTQLLTDIENDKVKTVYVFLEDRLFRDENQVNVSRFIDACQRHHIVVVTSRYIYYMVDERDCDLFRIECERAWKSFKSQLYDRMMPMRVFSSHRGYYDARCIIPGYYVEKEKHSPMFKKYVVYEPHAEKVRYLYHRFIELGGSVTALLHELEADPGPHFFGCPSDHFHKKSNLIKVTGGYRIGSRVTLQGILSNKTYLGTWCTGDREYPKNHAAIIDQGTWNTVQFLLRKAQESRSAHTTANKAFPSLIRGLLRHPRTEAEEEKRTRRKRSQRHYFGSFSRLLCRSG